MPFLWILIGLVVGAAATAALFIMREKKAEKQIANAEEQARQIVNDAIKSAESKKREALVEAKEEIHKRRSEYEREEKARRAELQKQERRLQQKEETLDRKTDAVEKKSETLSNRIAQAEAQQAEIAQIKKSQLEMLERISGFSVEEAKAYIIANVRDDVTHEMAMKIKEIEAQAKEEADERAIASSRCSGARLFAISTASSRLSVTMISPYVSTLFRAVSLVGRLSICLSISAETFSARAMSFVVRIGWATTSCSAWARRSAATHTGSALESAMMNTSVGPAIMSMPTVP